jgi:hypothetical protein
MFYLIKHQWGYQTCCPDEENTVGYFKLENPDEIKLYSKPSFDSQILKKTKSIRHENWKFNNSTSCRMTLEEMTETFGNIYNIENTDILIGKSNPIWGWEEIKDKENKITWIRIDENNNVWAPCEAYYSSSSDEDEEENSEMEKLTNSNSSDEDENQEVSDILDSPLFGKKSITSDPKSNITPPQKKHKII